MDSKSVDTDMENATPETNYFKMMMEDNQLGRVPFSTNDNADTDSIIGGQTIATLIHDGNNGRNNNHERAGNSASRDSESNTTAESYTQQLNDAEATNKSIMSIVGYDDDVSTIANDTVNETTKAFFTGSGDRKDSKPRIRLFKEYKTKDKESNKNSNSDYKTPEKKKGISTNPFDDDEETQPETPPGMINVPSLGNRSISSHKKKFEDDEYLLNGGKKKITKNTKCVYIIAGVLALILFVSIISLVVALRGVRETGESTSSSAINSENTRNEIISDLWPDLDVPIGNNNVNDDVNNANDSEIPSVTEPTDEEPIDEKPIEEEEPVVATTTPTAKPTLRPTAKPTRRPTPKPTRRPTPKPTRQPTAEPTLRTTAEPTLRPTTGTPTKTPTARPTNSPTLAPVPTNSPMECDAEITVLDFCFEPSVNIGITLSNCDSQRDDWVGVYRVDDSFDKNDLRNEAMWSYTCGTQNCREAVTQKTIPLNDVHADNNDWPLEPGIYIAILARDNGQPYSSYAASETFMVATQC